MLDKIVSRNHTHSEYIVQSVLAYIAHDIAYLKGSLIRAFAFYVLLPIYTWLHYKKRYRIMRIYTRMVFSIESVAFALRI